LTQLRKLTQHDVEDEAESRKSQEAEAVQARIRAAAVDLLEALAHEILAELDEFQKEVKP